VSKYKLQKLNFSSIEDFLSYLPDDEEVIVEYLRNIVLECIPDVREKLSYNVPYYYRHSRICFIWPSSVPWGNVPQYGVQLGFCNGNLLTDDDHYLEKGRRKKVYIKTFAEKSEIDVNLIKAYLYEAVEIDETLNSH
jgi:hypothetical protein